MSGEPRLPDTVQTIPEALAFWADRTPDAPAFVGPDQPVVTYAALWHQVETLAAALNRCGVGRRDRVALLLPEGLSLAVALLGTASTATAVPLSASLPIPDLDRALDGLHAAAALAMPSLPSAMGASLTKCGISVFALQTGAVPQPPTVTCQRTRAAVPNERPRPADIAIVNQTSGTTGKPKRVPRMHVTLMSSGRSHRDQYGLDRRDRGLLAAPMTLALGTSNLSQSIVAGSALVLPPLSDVGRFWDTLLAERPTWMQASAGFLELLARFVRSNPALPRPTSLRFVRVTAAAIAPAVCEELARYLSAPVLPSYSSSETGRVSMALPTPATNKPGSVGKPVQDVQIVDAEGIAVAAGSDGEIWVRGPKVFAGYLDDPATNEAAFMPGGWFRTGDTGYLDEDGYLYITGRVNELINRGGDKIAPVEVDAVLLGHPAVADAAVFAVPDDRLGEDVVAAVVPEKEHAVSPRELRRWMLDRLTTHKSPRRIWFVNELPRTASGKVQRGELARRWREERG